MLGQRLDAALTQAEDLSEEGWSRTRVRQLIDGGDVSCDGRVLSDPSYRLRPQDLGRALLIVIPPPKAVGIIAEAIPLTILHEDDSLLVIDKPAGLVVHPAAGNYSGTLVNAIAHHVGPGILSVGGEDRPGIVHRLDKDTSGVMVVAKDEVALASLQQQFAARSIERAYLALVAGPIWQAKGRIASLIGRDAKNRKKMAVVKRNGKQAITHFEVKARYADVACLVECRLETGRTHQIRVHMQSIGHGLIGDPMYPPARGFGIEPHLRRFPRQALHARLLGFEHPRSGEHLRFETEVSSDFAELLDAFAEAHPPPDWQTESDAMETWEDLDVDEDYDPSLDDVMQGEW